MTKLGLSSVYTHVLLLLNKANHLRLALFKLFQTFYLWIILKISHLLGHIDKDQVIKVKNRGLLMDSPFYSDGDYTALQLLYEFFYNFCLDCIDFDRIGNPSS